MAVGRFAARFHLCLWQGAGKQFAWLEVDFVRAASSRPAHQRVTPAVGRLETFNPLLRDQDSWLQFKLALP
jgi:hypothetical protein